MSLLPSPPAVTIPISTDRLLLFQRDKLSWEAAIANDMGNDPLELWYNYIYWYEQHVAFDTNNKFEDILGKCLSIFEYKERYKQDVRMVKLWMKYINLRQNPLNMYQILYQRGVGTQCAIFYIGWAHYYDSANAFKQAESVYNLGFQANAQPHEAIREAHTKFQLSIAQRMLYDDTPSKKRSASHLAEQRVHITTLKTSSTTAAAVTDADPVDNKKKVKYEVQTNNNNNNNNQHNNKNNNEQQQQQQISQSLPQQHQQQLQQQPHQQQQLQQQQQPPPPPPQHHYQINQEYPHNQQIAYQNQIPIQKQQQQQSTHNSYHNHHHHHHPYSNNVPVVQQSVQQQQQQQTPQPQLPPPQSPIPIQPQIQPQIHQNIAPQPAVNHQYSNHYVNQIQETNKSIPAVVSQTTTTPTPPISSASATSSSVSSSSASAYGNNDLNPNNGNSNNNNNNCNEPSNVNNFAYMITSSLESVYDVQSTNGYDNDYPTTTTATATAPAPINPNEQQQQQQQQQPQHQPLNDPQIINHNFTLNNGGIQLPSTFINYAKNNQETWNGALFLDEPNEPNKFCKYPKSLVYPGDGTEYSLEEIRGRKYAYQKTLAVAQTHSKMYEERMEWQRLEAERQQRIIYEEQKRLREQDQRMALQQQQERFYKMQENLAYLASGPSHADHHVRSRELEQENMKREKLKLKQKDERLRMEQYENQQLELKKQQYREMKKQQQIEAQKQQQQQQIEAQKQQELLMQQQQQQQQQQQRQELQLQQQQQQQQQLQQQFYHRQPQEHHQSYYHHHQQQEQLQKQQQQQQQHQQQQQQLLLQQQQHPQQPERYTIVSRETSTTSTSSKQFNDDFEEQIEASTIRFSTGNDTTKQKTLTIKFRKEKSTCQNQSETALPSFVYENEHENESTTSTSTTKLQITTTKSNKSNKKERKKKHITQHINNHEEQRRPTAGGGGTDVVIQQLYTNLNNNLDGQFKDYDSNSSTSTYPNNNNNINNHIDDSNNSLLLPMSVVASASNDDSMISFATSQLQNEDSSFSNTSDSIYHNEHQQSTTIPSTTTIITAATATASASATTSTTTTATPSNSMYLNNYGNNSSTTPLRNFGKNNVHRSPPTTNLKKQHTNVSNQNDDSMSSFTTEQNSFFATEYDTESKQRRFDRAMATIDAHFTTKNWIDPFNVELCKAFLIKMDFPSREHHNLYRLTNTCLPKLFNTKSATVADDFYHIEKEIGRGSYGNVYKAMNANTGEIVALKYQKPANTWELYICTEVKKKLTNTDMRLGFMDITSAVIAPNASIFVTEYSQYGSLLDINNRIRQNTTKVMHESLVMHFTSQILDIVHHLHSCRIIHADIKPDNFLLMKVPNPNSHVPTIRLIDFGCAIDMNLYKKNTQFKKIIQTDGFTCTEMKNGRPWSYQTDIFCIAGTVHVMLFGEYMQLIEKYGQWDIKQKLPRYLKKHIWTDFFTKFLNIKDLQNLPNLQTFKSKIDTELFNMDSELNSQIRNLSNILHKR